jgi:hypothetical protein
MGIPLWDAFVYGDFVAISWPTITDRVCALPECSSRKSKTENQQLLTEYIAYHQFRQGTSIAPVLF